MISDLRSACRQLVRAPGFALVTILTLALCIGANTAIFSVVRAVLLAPYPWPESNRLVYVYNTYPGLGLANAGVSVPDYLDRKTQVHAFADAGLYRGANYNLALDGRPQQIRGVVATPSLFSTLGVHPLLGRPFTDDDAAEGAPKVVLLSAALWRNHFGADRAVVGREIRLSGEEYTVIGVMPDSFYFPAPDVGLWTPYAFTAKQKSDQERGYEYSTMVARLRPEATLEEATAELAAVQGRNAQRIPNLAPFWKASGFGGRASFFLDENVKDVRPMLWLIQGAVMAALLIGCANVASLLLARGVSRAHEFALRTALGGSRRQIIRQLVVEGLLLAVLGGMVGSLFAEWGLSFIDYLGFARMPRGGLVHLDGLVLGFTAACTVLTGLAFSALPAWSATRGNAADMLRSAGVRVTAGRSSLRLRGILVAGEIALALMLLASAGLLLRSFEKLQDVNPGFRGDHVLTASLTLPRAKYGTPAERTAFVNALLERIRAVPGVAEAGVTSGLPLSGAQDQNSYTIVGRSEVPSQPGPHGMIRSVSPQYFQTLGIALFRGRTFRDEDVAGSQPVCVIDRILADRYWPGQDPVGHELSLNGDPQKWIIVGVAGATKMVSLEDPGAKETIYLPFAQHPSGSFSIVLKSNLGPAVVTALRQAVLTVDPEQPLVNVRMMQDVVSGTMVVRRSPMILVLCFAGLALLLAVIGVYGVLAFAVGQRRPEIGTRLALGATPRNILLLVLRQGAVLVAAGIVLGLLGYLAIAAILRTLVFDTAVTDPLALLVAPALLASAALAGCLLPARRAASVDPAVALRNE